MPVIRKRLTDKSSEIESLSLTNPRVVIAHRSSFGADRLLSADLTLDWRMREAGRLGQSLCGQSLQLVAKLFHLFTAEGGLFVAVTAQFSCSKVQN